MSSLRSLRLCGETVSLCAPLAAGKDWREHLRLIARLGVGAVEITGKWSELAPLDTRLRATGVRAALVRLQDGDDLPAAVESGAHVARRLGAPYLALSAGYLPAEEPSQLAKRCARLRARAEATGQILLVENHPQSSVSTGAALGGLAAAAKVGACFDPAGFVALRRHPFLTEFLPGSLKQRIACLRLRDALFEDGSEALPDRGNAELRELVSALEVRGYQGLYALSPFGAGLYEEALAAACGSVRGMLDEL